MLYERSLEIERRQEAVLGMIRKGSYSTPRMAEELGVSIPTVSRDVTALRQRGHDIRSECGDNGLRYFLVHCKTDCKGSRSPDSARREGR